MAVKIKNGYDIEEQRNRFRINGIPEPLFDWPFLNNRRFLGDMVWPQYMLILECDGGAFGGRPCTMCGMRPGGRHNTGAGFIKDMEKKNLAAAAGYRMLFCTPSDLKKPKIYHLIRAILSEPIE